MNDQEVSERNTSRPWPRVGYLRRYGPALLVVAALVAAGTVATTRSQNAAPSGGSAATGSTGNLTDLASNPRLPITYQMAEKAGTSAHYQWVQGCDVRTGRLKVPTIYAPPCVPVTRGSNGGATAPGVTATTITVVYYIPPPGDLASLVEGAAGNPASNLLTAQNYAAMFNHVMPLYGRRVQVVPLYASGTSTDAVAARADAIRVAQQIHAFASIGGPAQTPVYQDELARMHVLCLSCGVGSPYSEFHQDAPYLWSSLPPSDTVLIDAFTYITTQLLHRDAVWAGQASFRDERRRFALVSYEENPPIFGSLTKELDERFAKSGLTFVAHLSYLLDLTTLPEEAATVAEQLKRSNATTVVFAGDPIMPVYLTKACAAIGYYPEWVITGTVLTYTSTLGRLYDQSEWAHAFGISSISVPTPIQTGDAYHLYRWFFGTDPPAAETAPVILPPIEQLFLGLELAGPDLNGDTFAGGLFRYPPAGGTPTTPLESYGYQGAPPLPSFATPSDYTFVWYDPTAKGEDEEGVQGTGLIRYVDGGKRYPAATFPTNQVPMFKMAGSVTGDPNAPAGDGAPNYPPWPGSPTAKG